MNDGQTDVFCEHSKVDKFSPNWDPPLTKVLLSSTASIMHHTEMSAHKF